MHVVQRALSAVAVAAVVTVGLPTGVGAAPEPPRSATPTDPALIEELLGLVIGGLGQVGETLTVLQPVDIPGVSEWRIEWLRDGSVIDGETGWSFVPGLADVGHQVQARVTGLLLGIPVIQGVTQLLPITAAPTPETPTATKAPAITGDPKVGKQLTVTPPTWEGEGVTTTYQWLRAGAPIAGATTTAYTVAPEDVGKALSVRATGTREGAPATGTATSNTVTGVIGDAPAATTAVRITGTATVGQTLAATAPVWVGTGPIVTTYQWLRDGAPVGGATGQTYQVTPADADRALSVRATGTRTGYQPGTSTSAPVTVAPGAPLTATTAPSISGTPKVGSRLQVQPGTWSPEAAGTEHGFQWLRDGEPIPGATTDAYVVRADDAGHALAVMVTATATGYAPGSATTRAVEVSRMTSATTLALVKKRLPQGKRAKVRITVRIAGASPTGTVVVGKGRRSLATLTLRADGTAVGVLPKLKPGKHRLTAAFAGDTAVAGSASKPVTLTIVKRKRR